MCNQGETNPILTPSSLPVPPIFAIYVIIVASIQSMDAAVFFPRGFLSSSCSFSKSVTT
jgi:hypothetical protein